MCSFTQWLLSGPKRVFSTFLSSHRCMNVLPRHSHDSLHEPGPHYFLPISALPLPPQTSFPQQSVQCAHEYRHLDTESGQFAFAIRVSLSAPPPHPLSAAEARCLACSRAAAEKPKVTLMKSEVAFFFFSSFVYLLHLPVLLSPPSLAATWLPFLSLFYPWSHVSVGKKNANVWLWETDSMLNLSTARDTKTHLLSGGNEASLAAPFLPPHTVKVSSRPALIPLQGRRRFGVAGRRPLGWLQVHREGRKRRMNRHLMDFIAAVLDLFIYLFVCFLLAQM